MSQDRVRKLILFNLILCAVNVLLFAKPFLHLELFGAGALATAFGVTVIAVSVVLFGTVNYRLINAPAKPRPAGPAREPETLDECSLAANLYMRHHIKTFEANLKAVISQIDRFQRKKSTVREVLLEKFTDTEMSFQKFDAAVSSMERITLLNTRSFLNRINAFDEEEYEALIHEHQVKNRFQDAPYDKLMQSRMEIYNEYIAYGNKAVENNEQILIKLDQLILEITKLNTLNEGDIEELDAMREINTLIADAKWYK